MLKKILAHRWLAPLFWITIALLVKGAFFGWYLTQTYYHDVPGFLGQSNGDMTTYVTPVEHLLITGSFDTGERMPGYPLLYYVLRKLMNQADACNALIFIQLIVSAISVYILGLCAQRLFKNERAFYWAYFIYLFSTFASIFDAYFLTESLSASASIFFIHAWLRSEDKRRWAWLGLVVSGGWLTWSIFLKPAHAPLLAILPAIWGLQWLKGQLKFGQVVRYSTLFLLPFFVADGVWTLRNYRHYHEFIPLLKNPWYAESVWPTNYFDMMAFYQTYGEDYSFWFPNTGVRWMLGWKNDAFMPPLRWYVKEDLGPPPEYVYTSKFNRDSITHLRNLYYETANNPNLDSTRRKAYHAEIHEKLAIYTKSVQEEKPFVYYVRALSRYTFTFFNGTWGYNFLDDIVPAQWPRWLLRAYHYVFILLPGVVGLALLLIRGLRKEPRLLAAPMAIVICTLVYVVMLRHPETRYLVPFYPFLVLSAVCTFLSLPMLKFVR
ncbi:hypothetical protein GCM10028807_59050 [Spirosoma daeguense]